MQLELNTNFLGRKNEYYKKIDSTQQEIWRRIENNSVKNGLLIMSDLQTSGRGTHGRVWHTDEENNIAFSFYIETGCMAEILDGITYEIAEVMVEVIKNLYNICLEIKNPNDIIFDGQKIGGILTESKVCAGLVKFIVVGIGVNTNKTRFSDDIAKSATSIKKEFKLEVDNEKVISEFCNLFEKKIIERIGEFE
jgi:BirA family biotin operon repressor/biotin-[acetyl-CoA-carboxylase] ligase